MSLGGYYDTGTASTDADPRVILIDGALLTAVALPGDWFWANGHIGIVETVDDDGQITLQRDWTGGALEDDEYLLIKLSWQRYDPAVTQEQVRKFLALLSGGSVMYRVKLPATAPDPGLGDDGDFAIQTDNGSWTQWQKVAGVWEDIGTPLGTNWRGAWSSATEYVLNDLVEYQGSTWVALSVNTNLAPASNPSDWELSASKGDPGNDGGVITFPLVFDGTSTADSDPGNGKIRIGPGASQRVATVWRVDLLDHVGLDWTGTWTDLAAGTSTIKVKARLAKQSDQTARIVANVTAVATPSGYRNLTVAVTDYSSDNPFANGDELLLTLDPKGDKGDTGNTGATGAGYRATSTTSLPIQLGSASLTTQAGLAYTVGSRARLSSSGTPSAWMEGLVSAYNSSTGAMTVAVDKINNSGTYADWNLNAAGEPGAAGAAGINGASALTIIRAMATGNVAIATALEAGDVIDGVTLAANDLVGLPAQSDATENGIYSVPSSGAASRATAFDTYNELAGSEFNVLEGTANGGSKWRCTNPRGGTLGVDDIDLVKNTSMDGSNNLSELTDVEEARDNLELGDLATKNLSELADPVAMAIIFGA